MSQVKYQIPIRIPRKIRAMKTISTKRAKARRVNSSRVYYISKTFIAADGLSKTLEEVSLQSL